MFEAVLAVAVGAAHAGVFESVDEGFAGEVGALVGVVDVGFFWRGAVLFLVGCAVVAPCPVAGAGAFVRSFGPVFEAVGAVAGLAAEGEEIELAAVLELAVAADRFEVFIGHLGEGLFWCVGGRAPFGYGNG